MARLVFTKKKNHVTDPYKWNDFVELCIERTINTDLSTKEGKGSLSYVKHLVGPANSAEIERYIKSRNKRRFAND